MEFIELVTSKEKHYIAKDLIGHWSITQHKCSSCAVERSVLDVYDREARLLCSIVCTESEIDDSIIKLSKTNDNESSTNNNN